MRRATTSRRSMGDSASATTIAPADDAPASRRRLPYRSATGPVALALVAIAGLIASALLSDLGEPILALILAVAAAIPIGFLAVNVGDELAGRAAGRHLLDRLVTTDLAGWRDVVADAVGDPGLRLGFWDPAAAEYREPSGGTLTPVDVALGRTWVPVQRGEDPLAAIVADRAVTQRRQVMSAATEATILAAEILQSESDLRQARAQVAVAESAARERMGRDLHDSAQQRLIALRIHLGLARERLRPADRSAIDELDGEVDSALREIRSIAVGTDVSGLAEGGLGAALTSAAARSGLAVTVHAEDVPRYEPHVEHAVLYTVLEALQNAAKHGGATTAVTLLVRARARRLTFAIADNGPGFTTDERGSGIDGMRARLRGVGGQLRMSSTAGEGTCVVGTVPTA